MIIGCLVALGVIAALITSMQRWRARLVDLLLRFEALVEPAQRRHVRHLTRMSASLFYAQNLLRPLDRMVADFEKKKGIAVGGNEEARGRFSKLFGRQLANMTTRLEALEALEEQALEEQAPEDQAPEDQAPEDQAPEEQAPEEQAPEEQAGKDQ